MEPHSPRLTVIDAAGLQVLVDVLRDEGWTVLGPTVEDGVVRHSEIRSVDDLPRGIGDEQDAATYRVRSRDDSLLFGYAVGPQSWKSVFFPARELLRRIHSDGSEAGPADPEPGRVALLGVRSCDLHAIAVQDRVLHERPFADAHYAARRNDTFVVAVTCSDPGGTCFCASMGTGPEPEEGFDLALTELLDDDGHRFLVRVGSDRAAEVAQRLPGVAATESDRTAAAAVAATASQRMGRSLDTEGLKDLLYANADHPQWDDVASRCLSCSNCTLVCPTCFCTSIEDTTELASGATARWRVWDSCFTSEFTHLGDGSIRSSTRSRYRQWATHKLGSWWDQFGTSGCVGCGRCVTWCPAAIDLTAEMAAIRAGSPTDAPTTTDPTEA